MGQPFEIVGQPLSLWLAPVGTTFPLIGAAPSGSWALIGTSGTRNQDEGGVTTTHSQTIQKVRPGGTTGAVKAFRNEEDLSFKLTIWDLTLEQLKVALNANTLTTTAAGVGTAGFKSIGLSRGVDVTEYALLARGSSPYGDGMTAQYQVPRCFMSNSPAIVHRKGVPAGVELMFDALEDLSAASADLRFGKLVFQHAVAL
ncbi:hypothetical protein [Novosphingobium huizhouense]|uniref:hypothetical protein n=1 Tax=Novosphingobium huizhouense TaxID=2866625 RepID=UPI001CD861A7|nr:hypothetical protein [Novosphingobium huizhouense]